VNELHVGDCLDLLPTVGDGAAALVFADPPFNIGYRYDRYDDRRGRADYLAWADGWLAELYRVLAPHGSLWLAIGDDYAAEYRVKLDALGLYRRNWVVWHYTFGVHCQSKFGRDHTHLFYYTKSERGFTWNADAVRVPSARSVYGDKRADPRGRVPGDVWTVPRVCGTFKERNKAAHGCQMPEAVLERIILATSNPGDVVLDPFGGAFTTAAVAKRLGRQWWSCELSEEYCKAGAARLAAVVPEAVLCSHEHK
jgi:DNA modification methylase